MKQVIQFSLNGEAIQLEIEPDRSLLWVLRGDLALTGTKYGCGTGLCGACSVLLDGQVVSILHEHLDELNRARGFAQQQAMDEYRMFISSAAALTPLRL